METYQRNKKSVAAFDAVWCAVWLAVAASAYYLTCFDLKIPITLVAAYCAYLIAFRREIRSSYRKSVVISEDGLHYENVTDRRYTYAANYADAVRVKPALSTYYGNPALEIRLKNGDKVIVDAAYRNAAVLWESIVDGICGKSQGAEIDDSIIKRIEKMKKKA